MPSVHNPPRAGACMGAWYTVHSPHTPALHPTPPATPAARHARQPHAEWPQQRRLTTAAAAL
eukprot:6477661-Prymnesium_polylepis.1